MKILSLCKYEFYQYPDSSFVHNQAAAFVHQGHTVVVIVLTPIGKKIDDISIFRGKETCIDGVRIIYLRYLSLSKYGEHWFNDKQIKISLKQNLHKLYDLIKPDIIHIHTIGYAVFGEYLKSVFSCPVIATAHGSDVNGLIVRNRNLEVKKLCEKTDGVIAVSTSLEKGIRFSGAKTKIKTIVNGFKSIPNNDHIYNKTEHSWIQVGHLITLKHYEITIEAFSKYITNHPDATLTIIGEGNQKRKLIELVNKRGIDRQVFFLGQLSNTEVLSKMQKSQFFVMVSYPEGLGIVYLEAMRSGCIVVGTRGEGIQDIIVSGHNGFLVERDSPEEIIKEIEKCEKKPQLMKSISLEAQKSVEMLTWENNAKNCIDFFEQILKSRKEHN